MHNFTGASKRHTQTFMTLWILKMICCQLIIVKSQVDFLMLLPTSTDVSCTGIHVETILANSCDNLSHHVLRIRIRFCL